MMSNPPREMLSILMVEDNEDDFEAMQRAFSKNNIRNPVKRVTSGEAALSWLQEDGNAWPGIILLDLNMPGMDGRKVLAFIKQQQSFKKIPVIVLTTSDDDRDVKQCYELGANTYIRKPMDFNALVAAVRQLKEYWFETAILPKEVVYE